MKKLQTSKESNNTKTSLVEIDKLINSPKTQSIGVFLLNEVDRTQLNDNGRAFFYFIKGRYLLNLFNQGDKKDVRLLTSANHVFDTVRSLSESIKNRDHLTKYYFLIIKAKLLQFQNQNSSSQKAFLKRQARKIIQDAIKLFPKNKSFVQLQSELT